MSIDWISKMAEDRGTKVGEVDLGPDASIAVVDYADDALTLHMNNASFELLANLMQAVGCDLSSMPIDNSGDFVDADIARTWAQQLTDARPNIVLVTVWFPAEDGQEPAYDEVLTLAGTFDLAGYVEAHNTSSARMAEVFGNEPEPPVSADDLTVEEVHLDALEGEDVYVRELVDKAIVLLRDGDGFYQW